MKFPIFLLVIVFVLCAAVSAQTRNSDPVLQGSANYAMPQEAIDAGIDGKVAVGIHVDETGKPTKATLILGPMWPCGSKPVKALNSLSSTLSDTVLKLHFDPAIKNGKPVASDIVLRMTITNPMLGPRLPLDIDPATGKAAYRIVTEGVINGKALSLPIPSYPAEAKLAQVSGTVVVQVLIDERGKVVRSGAVSDHSLLQYAAREAACGAIFAPTVLKGNPVQVSGIITYNFNR